MADRIVVLSGGRILQTGAPREIYERPVSPWVALQLGQPAINLLPARRLDGYWVATDGTPLVPADPAGSDARLLGIRPEHIVPEVVPQAGDAADDRGAAGCGTAEAVVEIVEYIGPTTTLLCAWAGAHVHIVIPRRGNFHPGDRIRPRIDAAHAVLFEPDSQGGS